MISMLSGGAFYGLYSYRQSNRSFEYHRQQLELLEYLTIAVVDLRTPATPEVEAAVPLLKRYLDRLQNVQDRVEHYRKNLNSAASEGFVVGDITRQGNELELLQKLVDDVRKYVTKEATRKLSLTSHESNWFRTDEVSNYFLDVSSAVGRLRGHIHQSVRDNVEIDRANYRTAMGIVYSTSVLVVLLLFALVWLGYRAVFHPIRALHRGVVKLAARQFDSRVSLDSGDEMQELGSAFNDMADKLQDVYRALNRQVGERSMQVKHTQRFDSVGDM